MKNETKKIEGISERILIKKLLEYFRPYSWHCILLGVVVFFSLAATLLQPVLWSKLLAALFSQNIKGLSKILIAMVALYLVLVGINFIQSTVTSYLNAQVICSMQNNLFCKMLSMNMTYFDKNSAGAFIARMISDVSQIIDTVTKQIVPALINLLKVILLFFIMIKINIFMTMLTVGLLPVTLYIYSKNTKKMREKQLDVKRSSDDIVSILQQAISGIKNIKVLGIKNAETNLFETKNRVKTKKMYSFAMFVVVFQTILSIIGMFGEVSIYIFGGYFVLKELITVEKFIQFASYSQQFGNSSLSLVNLVADYQKILVSLRRLYEIEESVGQYHEKFGSQVITGIEGNIEINNLTYAYGEKAVLEDISLYIPSNKVTAITGNSGSGKTTLLDLVSGLYHSNAGEIKINGAAIQELSEKSLREYIAVVSQQHFLFHASIIENFRYIKPEITLEEIQSVCRECEIHHYIDELPDKYNTVIYENGNNFSVGQLQRLSIARALAKNAQILLLDEPTSSLDLNSRSKMKEVIHKLRQYKTIVIVSHDMEFIKNADKTYRIEKGKVMQV